MGGTILSVGDIGNKGQVTLLQFTLKKEVPDTWQLLIINTTGNTSVVKCSS